MLKLKDAIKPKEADIRKTIQQYLNLRGIFNWRQWQGQFSVRGVPDIIGIIPNDMLKGRRKKLGKILAIEVKLPGWKCDITRKHDLEQVRFIEKIRAAGGIAFFAGSVEEVEIELEKY